MGPKLRRTREYRSIWAWHPLQGCHAMRESDLSTSLSHADSVIVPSGDLQLITFIAEADVRSIFMPTASWHRMSSWMNLPRLTIEVTSGSEAAHNTAGWVSMPARPCEAGQVALTKVVLSVGAPFGKPSPGNSVARRLLTQNLWELRRSSTVPAAFVQTISLTNCCVEARRSFSSVA